MTFTFNVELPNKKMQRTGHLFERRHRAILVQADAYLKELVRYIHLNPLSGEWGDDYSCIVCGVNDTALISTDEKLECPTCHNHFEFFNKNINKIDGFIVSLPNFSDELGIVNTLQGVHKKLPVLVHAFDDDIEKLGYVFHNHVL